MYKVSVVYAVFLGRVGLHLRGILKLSTTTSQGRVSLYVIVFFSPLLTLRSLPLISYSFQVSMNIQNSRANNTKVLKL